jgi:hypothetical protein
MSRDEARPSLSIPCRLAKDTKSSKVKVKVSIGHH